MPLPPSDQTQANHSSGLLMGFIGVLGFSFTLPASRLAVASFDPVIVGPGRALVAACLAGPLLLITRQKRPSLLQWRSLLVMVLGVVIGFPALTSWAMRLTPASHGAVVLGLLPLATALAGTLRAHERPSRLFWAASVAGSCTVIGFALGEGGGSFHPADLALLGAVVLAAFGYAEGGHVARELGGWQTVCWALMLAAPIVIGPVGYVVWRDGLAGAPSAWVGLAYVSLISMFLAFIAWYRGLAQGGVTRVSQIQLLQPFLTLALSWLFLGEQFGLGAVVCAVIVALLIFVGRRAK